ncbi:MAG: Gfo/Idh/MocA family oxidoreductase [Candidatus Electryonea clarkiae]|nr:Gfo/Idh/MocA family oxidoreductase [Candidatus Electryonea clarkiae]MDP8286221.1 Gfo/Idh/MocA family oxidoreductase [Candidatus Electryonea clarkiae]
MEKISVGVIGVGRLGRFHALKYAANDRADLVGVYDMDGKAASKVAGETGSTAFSNIEELLSKVDAVSVAVFTDSHYVVGLQVLEDAKHMLVEKPITSRSEQARELVAIAEKKNLVLQVGHIERFNPAVRALHGIKINPRFVEAHRLAPYSARGADVSVVHDLMIHDIDVLLHWMGNEIERVDASGVPVITDAPDIANARISFSGKRAANLTASRISLKRMRKFRIFQEDAYISVDFEKRSAHIYQQVPKGTPKSMPIPGALDSDIRVLAKKTRAKKDDDALSREIDAFLVSIQTGKPAFVTGKEALPALELVEEIARQCE